MRPLPPSGEVRHPTVRLLVADAAASPSPPPLGTTQPAPQQPGQQIPGLISAEMVSNAHYQADKFSIELALDAPNAPDIDWWGQDKRKGMTFELRMTLRGEQEQSLIVGEADDIDIDPMMGTVKVQGRDLTSRFIDAQTQEAFQNQTASQIATLLAKRRGLKAVVTETNTPVSRYYGADHDRVQHDQFSRTGREWDLLCRLAQDEGFDVFVQGRELHFAPAIDPTKADAFGVRIDPKAGVSTVMQPRLHRSLTLAKDVVVVVRSWHSGKGEAFSRSSPKGSATKVNEGKAQRYTYTRPNLTEDQAQKLADSYRADITKHERLLEFACPGELTMIAQDVILLSGCGSWDQRYFVDTVTRRISMAGGFTQQVTAKNHHVESQAA